MASGNRLNRVDFGNSTGVIENHHLLPRQFEAIFKSAGLEIGSYTVPLDKAFHRLSPDGLHTGTNSWNKQWASFIKQNPGPDQLQILNQLDKMMKAYGLR